MSLNLMYAGTRKIGTFAISVDPDEVPHDAAFHQDLHFLRRSEQLSGTKNCF